MANNLKKRFYDKKITKTKLLESKINHRIKISNVFSLVKLFSPLRDFHFQLIKNRKIKISNVKYHGCRANLSSM